MSDRAIQLGMLAVQILALIGLTILYVWETWKLRKTSQEQVRISNDLIRAAMDQVEGLSKPCLTLWSELRDQKEAIMELGGVRGSTKAKDDHGDFVVQNIGNGFAANITYRFTEVEPSPNARKHHIRYIQNINAGQSMTMIEPVSAYAGLWNLTLHYESIGGRRYETLVTLNGLVLIAFTFREIDRGEGL